MAAIETAFSRKRGEQNFVQEYRELLKKIVLFVSGRKKTDIFIDDVERNTPLAASDLRRGYTTLSWCNRK